MHERSVIELALRILVALGCGMSLPFILRKVGFDPAAASAPLVASMADIAGVLIYLGIALLQGLNDLLFGLEEDVQHVCSVLGFAQVHQ